MSDFSSKTPFFRLLLPVVAAIILSEYAGDIPYSGIISVLGLMAMLFSYFIPPKKRFSYRWIFGAAAFVFVFGLTAFVFEYRNTQSQFVFADKPTFCVGTVLDIPQEKARSFSCNLDIDYPVSRKIVVYLQKDENARNLNPGDEILFSAQIQPFKNLGNPDDFDYARFMRIKGFSGSAYLSTDSWMATGKQHTTLYIFAQQFRKKALGFYRSFQLDDYAYSFISALTLGYKNELDDELQAAFRASGTSHVLAVSGLHVSIIYAVFAFLFSFMGRGRKTMILRQVIIIIMLWLYAFITGFSASVVRATIMLTIVCIGLAWRKKGFTYNSLAAAALAILVYNPQSLFNVGFQMSFMAVFFILYFQPKLAKFYTPKNKATKFIWDLCTVSIAAQMGLAPVVLYYFGAFPTYFFVANMLVVPLIMLVIYGCIPLILLTLLKPMQLLVIDILLDAFRWVEKMLIDGVLFVVYYIESLLLSQFKNIYLTLPQVFLAIAVLLLFTHFLITKKAKMLIAALTGVLLFALTFTFQFFYEKPPQWVVFNKPNVSDIGLYVNQKRVYTSLAENGFIAHRELSVLRLSQNNYQNVSVNNPMEINVLILSTDRTFSMLQLSRMFLPHQVVLDSSLASAARNRMKKECAELGISVHDVVQEGAFFINL